MTKSSIFYRAFCGEAFPRTACVGCGRAQRLTIDPERPTSRASCLKRLPTRSATRSTILCSNTSISLRPLASKVGRRQYARPRRRYQMGDAKCRTEHAGALEHRRRHQFLNDRRRFVLLAQAGVAVEHRQRDKRPALMADRAEIAVGDQIERLLAAIVGMHPPSDVRQQAGGMAQAAILVGFPQLHDPHQTIGPFDQFLGMARGSRQQLVQRLRGADQSVP